MFGQLPVAAFSSKIAHQWKYKREALRKNRRLLKLTNSGKSPLLKQNGHELIYKKVARFGKRRTSRHTPPAKLQHNFP